MNATNVAASRHPHAKSELRNAGKNERWLTSRPQRQSARTRSCGKQKEGLDSTHLITIQAHCAGEAPSSLRWGEKAQEPLPIKGGVRMGKTCPPVSISRKESGYYKIPLAGAQLNVQILAVLSVTYFILFHISLRSLISLSLLS